MMQHWRTTITGAGIAGLLAVSTIANADNLKWWQIVCAFLAAALITINGAVGADAKQTPKDPS